MWGWFQTLDGSIKSLIIAVFSAVFGGLIKWMLDRPVIRILVEEREAARRDRELALTARQNALEESADALKELAMRQAESQQRQAQLDRLGALVDAKEVEVATERRKLDTLLATLRETESGIWTAHGKVPPFADFNSRITQRRPLVITVANNKGGVGKTTIVGNLLAYFDNHVKCRVLAIDLDYQGSLSTMLRQHQVRTDQRRSNVDAVLRKGADNATLATSTRKLGPKLPRSELVTSFYELAQLEDRLLVEWLLQEGGDDVRYRLASVLLQDNVAEQYDVVLLDVPPRISTATINALCASTHVLVPTIFNPLAAEPVSNFLQVSRLLMGRLNPGIRVLGVVESMAPPAGQARDIQAEGRRVIDEALRASFPDISILSSKVPRRAAIAEGGVAYLEDPQVRDSFKALGDEIRGRVGL